MKDIIRIERKRVLSVRNLLIFSTIILIYSIFSSLLSVKSYNIYDSSGNIVISARENLRESKLDKHNKILDENTIKDVVIGKDESKYQYNSNLVTLIASNYDKKIEELTESDIKNFYDERILNLTKNMGKRFYNGDVEKIIEKAKKIKMPIEIGYAEGWKNLNSDMIDFITIIIFIIPFVILNIFGQDLKTNIKQLCITTKYGKKKLIKSKIIVAIYVGTILYCVSILIFSISKLFILGFQGGNLPIQGSVRYLCSPYNLTFFQQYLINVIVAFIAMLVLVGVTLVITSITEEILSSAIVITFILGIMTMFPNNNYNFNHYFKNFIPYHMINFNRYYIQPDVYSIGNEVIPTYILVILVSCIIFMVLTISTAVISNRKLSRRLK